MALAELGYGVCRDDFRSPSRGRLFYYRQISVGDIRGSWDLPMGSLMEGAAERRAIT